MNIVELFVLMKKVIKGGGKINELMRSFIEDKLKEISVEAFQDPLCGQILQAFDSSQHDSFRQMFKQKPFGILKICRETTQMQGQQNK